MKKIIAFIIIFLLVFMIAACDKNEVSIEVSAPGLLPPMSLPEYPVIDGSSSTVIMHAAIRAYLTDAHLVDGHSQTYTALERLIPGSDDPADVVLAVKYYDGTLRDAKNRGADLVITPVAKEGFVFILHKDNPIDGLTQQQLRDIYSGKITNWKDAGGKDETIIPYIRNWDSGSQTAMENFMAGEPVIGENDNIISGMEALLTQVQLAGSPGIGYNIYSWSMGQDLDKLGLKVVTVDSVKPENKTLSDSSYPLMVYTYSYYNKGNEKGEALTDWLLTAEGQSVIASAGYVGIFGEPQLDETFDLNMDDYNSGIKAEEYYVNKGMLDFESMFFYSERLTDNEQTEALSVGKEKAVTVLRLAHFSGYEKANETVNEYTRFIVLTREKGGEFEVINEGAVLSYENGILTPDNG